MRAGRGIRVAAVGLVGLVGLAVVAPGIASADTATPTCTSGQVVEAGVCVPAATGSTTVPEPAPAPATVPSVSGQAPTATDGTSGSSGTGAPASPSVPTSSGGSAATGGGAAGETVPSGPADGTTPPVVTPETVVTDTPATVSKAAAALTGVPATGTSLGDVLGNLPTGNLTGLPTIPELPAGGTFTNPQDACVYLASKVNAPTGQESALGGQFASFCDALPDSFGAGDLTGLISKLTDLLDALKATPAPPSPSTHTTPIHAAWGDLPASFHDLDCGQLTYDEAQAVLADDRSDPNHLDGDHDGIACERNQRDYRTVCDDYTGYPVGAVATGDSAPAVDPRVATALGGIALAAVAGAGVTRREDPEDDQDTSDRADLDDLLTAEER
jgi:hypothetical protein